MRRVAPAIAAEGSATISMESQPSVIEGDDSDGEDMGYNGVTRHRGPDLCISAPGRLARDCGAVFVAVRGDLMRLAIEGKIIVTQRGRPVAVENLKGPIRVGIARAREYSWRRKRKKISS
jgi:hypothetical protein